ncbi:T-cell surface glycoprotein CD1e, membrane-associated isoform X3 [Macaca fascicularis]|uniref:T-cell surface glycoprotein CD1e, membrane-associated isoform X3 n=1 Tax=Macaca fascicularis TaxID=9541 RepID=UPI0032B081C3
MLLDIQHDVGYGFVVYGFYYFEVCSFDAYFADGPGTFLVAPQALKSYRPAAEDPLSFRMLQISSFANHSWAHSEGSGWLGDLQTHGWDTVTGTIRFLKPWSHGNFSKQELKNLQSLFQLYFNGFVRIVQASAGQFQLEYPFEIQILAGCRMNAPQIFLNMAYQGSDFLSFQGISWEPSPGAGIRAQNVCKVLSRYLDIKEILQSLLGHTCPRFLAGLMEAGESELKRKVKPEAWLSRGPSPGPGRLQLVCHVSGFYPKPVWVMWMRGEQEQRGTQRGDILPNADETWYLRATLDVATGEAAGLSCRVKHSSIEGHDLIIHWVQIRTLFLPVHPALRFPWEPTPRTPIIQDITSAWHKYRGSKTDS